MREGNAAKFRVLAIGRTDPGSGLAGAARHRGVMGAAASMAQVQAPLLQSHGDADEVIPIELGRALFEAAPDPKQFLTHLRARHNDPMPPSYDQELRQFLAALPQ